MSTTDVLHGVRHDPGTLDERTERVRRDLLARAETTRDQLATLTSEVGGELSARAAVLGEDLGARAHVASALIGQRYREIEQELPLEAVALKARIGAWRAARLGVSGLVAVPGLLVRGLRVLSTMADDVAERGASLSERGRELAAAVPPSKSERRRTRLRTISLVSIGLAVGVVIGRIWAARPPTDDPFEVVSSLDIFDGQMVGAESEAFEPADLDSEPISADEPGSGA